MREENAAHVPSVYHGDLTRTTKADRLKANLIDSKTPMGMRKKIRNIWKAERKVNLAAQRKQKAKRFAAAAAAK